MALLEAQTLEPIATLGARELPTTWSAAGCLGVSEPAQPLREARAGARIQPPWGGSEGRPPGAPRPPRGPPYISHP